MIWRSLDQRLPLLAQNGSGLLVQKPQASQSGQTEPIFRQRAWHAGCAHLCQVSSLAGGEVCSAQVTLSCS